MLGPTNLVVQVAALGARQLKRSRLLQTHCILACFVLAVWKQSDLKSAQRSSSGPAALAICGCKAG